MNRPPIPLPIPLPIPNVSLLLRLVSGAVLLSALIGCDADIRRDAQAGLDRGQRLTAAQRARLKAQQAGEVIREDRPFYGSAVPVKRGSQRGKPLPAQLEGARGFSISLQGRSDVQTIAAAITAASDIPVNIRTRYVLPEGDVVEVPIGGRMTASFEGSLSAFLDRLSARMDIGWHYNGTVITLDRMVRRTWRIALPFGQTEMASAVSPDGGASVNVTRRLNGWEDLKLRLDPLAPPPARVTLAPETGRVTVFGPPSVIATAGAVLEDVAATAAMRIGLDVAVYFLDSEKADSFGIGLTNAGGSFANGGGRDVAGILSAAVSGDLASAGTGGTLTIRRGSASIDFRALARDRAVVDYRLGSTVAQSGAASPIALTRTQNFVSKREVSTEEGVTTVEVSTESLETGIAITALPRLIDRQTIQLALTLSQRDLVSLEEFGEGDSKVQLPVTDTRTLRNDSVLAPGEVLIFSGYEQEVSESNKRGAGLFNRIGLGGENSARRRLVRMVVMVRPTLIPVRGGS